MSDALPLPPRSRLEQYKKLAKELVEANDAAATQQWATRWLESLAKAMNKDAREPETRELIRGGVQWLGRAWKQVLKEKKREGPATLTDAQFLIARAHGFESWPKFAKHLESREGVEGSPFETAADAIVDGDIETLRTMLRQNPALIVERSEREHHSTLLHYVSANGIEDFRQKTPPNIVDIARLLLDAGADVNAESDAYGGRSTVLELTGTSVHPEVAGVQIELMTLLLERGALIDGVRGDSIVNACLANGRGEAAEFLAVGGAKLDLDGAAGAGRFDVVRSFFDDRGSLRPPATGKQMLAGFVWACEFNRADVAVFLLDHGVDIAGKFPHGETGLHWAAYEGHAGIAKILLERGAPLAVKDDNYGGTPLDWAIYGWGHISPQLVTKRRHHEAVALLIRAGAKLDPGWYEGTGLLAKVNADARMRAAIEGGKIVL